MTTMADDGAGTVPLTDGIWEWFHDAAQRALAEQEHMHLESEMAIVRLFSDVLSDKTPWRKWGMVVARCADIPYDHPHFREAAAHCAKCAKKTRKYRAKYWDGLLYMLGWTAKRRDKWQRATSDNARPRVHDLDRVLLEKGIAACHIASVRAHFEGWMRDDRSGVCLYMSSALPCCSHRPPADNLFRDATPRATRAVVRWSGPVRCFDCEQEWSPSIDAFVQSHGHHVDIANTTKNYCAHWRNGSCHRRPLPRCRSRVKRLPLR
jgi:hypothetical protein